MSYTVRDEDVKLREAGNKVIVRDDEGNWQMKKLKQQIATLEKRAVQDLIHTIVNDTIAEKDRTVTIRIDPDGAISVSIYPTIN